ncbi:hypothetical protein BpHYR1_034706 [Brachionus plicatilis]|uniref:Uncharacterized protein n=1 Tax=Brachionus plicatilis TaxID=10195 RepID=A0A3M7PWR0_BRAPC|nr:hypothetical protein BpHYR1_034706 [Brachionus plicatilis]
MAYQNSQKLSSLPPHMQQPYAQVYPNQSQPRAQLMPNRYQASPNKTKPNMDPAANMYKSNTYPMNQQQTSPNQTFYQNNPQQQQQQYSPYNTSTFSVSNPTCISDELARNGVQTGASIHQSNITADQSIATYSRSNAQTLEIKRKIKKLGHIFA